MALRRARHEARREETAAALTRLAHLSASSVAAGCLDTLRGRCGFLDHPVLPLARVFRMVRNGLLLLVACASRSRGFVYQRHFWAYESGAHGGFLDQWPLFTRLVVRLGVRERTFIA